MQGDRSTLVAVRKEPPLCAPTRVGDEPLPDTEPAQACLNRLWFWGVVFVVSGPMAKSWFGYTRPVLECLV